MSDKATKSEVCLPGREGGVFHATGIMRIEWMMAPTRIPQIITEPNVPTGGPIPREWSLTRVGKDGIALSRRIARLYNIQVGDEVEVTLRVVRRAARPEEGKVVSEVELENSSSPSAPTGAVDTPPTAPEPLPDGLAAVVSRVVGEGATVKRGPGRPRKVDAK